MRLMPSIATAIASVAILTVGAVSPSDAACRKMGFLVNDYGKDGPSKDAQELLEKDVAKWAAGQGIQKYTVSKKDVTCELFLNFIVFDEHTCTASATVCWDEKTAGKSAVPATTGAVEKTTTEASAKPDTKSEKTATTSDAKPDTKSEKTATTSEAKPDTKNPAAEAKTTKDNAKVETGTVASKEPAAAAAAAASPVTGQPAAASPEKDPSQAAAAAAERAAAAAERAAVAAERAAQAAMDAQNQVSQGSAPAAQAAPATTASSDSAAPAVVKPITPLPSSSTSSPAP